MPLPTSTTVTLDPPGHLDPVELAAPQPAPAPAATRHPDYLVGMARSLGMPQDQIDRRSTDSVAAWVEGRHAAMNQQMSAFERLSQSPRPAAAPAAPPPDPFEDFEFDEFEETDEKGLSKKQKAKLSEMQPFWKAVFRKVLKEQKEMRDQLGGVASAVTRGRSEAAFDEAFEIIAEQHPGFYGDGTMAELLEAGDQTSVDRRVKLARAALVGVERPPSSPRRLAALLAATIAEFSGGAKKPAAPAAAPRPANPYLPDAVPAPAARTANGHAAGNGAGSRPKDPVTGFFLSDSEIAARQQWDRGGTGVPSGRGGPAIPNGQAKAEATVRRMLNEFAADDDTPPDVTGSFVP